jgi:hypothetical protein
MGWKIQGSINASSARVKSREEQGKHNAYTLGIPYRKFTHQLFSSMMAPAGKELFSGLS